MIRSLLNFADISCIDLVGSESDLLPLLSINYFETEIGSGGFGAVFKIESINGIQTSKYVLKVLANTDAKDHAYETISLLHTKIKKALINEEGTVYNKYPELLGLPFLVCKAYDEIQEKEVIAFIIHNLNENNYKDFGSDSFDKSKYMQVEIPDRIYYAFQFIKTIKFLNELNFLHSDISENSIWINNTICKIALIDYDSGFHIDTQKKPTTLGKIGHWIGSNYSKIFAKEINAEKLTIGERIDEENWVISNAVFELIFGVSPFFFLLDSEEKTKANYLKKHTWPEIDVEYKMFNQTNLIAYKSILDFYNLLKENGFEKLINAFDKVFNAGYKNPNKRVKVAEWYEILFEIGEGLNLIPKILEFKSDKKTVNSSDEEVTFNWTQSKGYKTYINDILINGLNYKVSFSDSINVTLRVINEFGESYKELSIEANKITPTINFFKSDTIERLDLTPVIISWNTKDSKVVKISGISNPLQTSGTHEIDPQENKIITLTAIGNFDEEVNAEIEIKVCCPEIVDFRYEINIEKGIDNIDLYWETKNTNQVHISPRVGVMERNGGTSIRILDKTEFTLSAVGFFATVEMIIETQPFPIPIIKGILVPTPILDIDFIIPIMPIDEINLINTNIGYINVIELNSLIPDFHKLEEKIEQHSLNVNKNNKNRTSIDVFHNVFRKIYNYKT